MPAEDSPAPGHPGHLAPSDDPMLGATPVPDLDETDRAIVGELWRDARLSVRTLAARVHISRTNAYARLERLIADGVITGFGARIDPRRAGLGTSAYVMVTIEQNAWRAVADDLRRIPHVEQVTLVGGDFDILVLVRTPDNATLRDVVLGHIQDVDRVRATRTWLVFEEAAGVGSFP
jgi:DNA-binding Lrp family transcriptional regulator